MAGNLSCSPPKDVALQNEGEFDEEATVLLAEEAEIAVPPEVKDSEQWIGDAMETMAGGEADSVGEPAADDEEEPEPEPSPITARQAADHLIELQRFYDSNGMDAEATWVIYNIPAALKMANDKMVQKRLTDFIKPKSG